MVAVLLTGMSGTGKSTVIAELTRHGFGAVDTDYGGYVESVAVEGQGGTEPMWREDRISALLDEHRGMPLFVAGCVVNQVRFYSRFAAVVLLSAPLDAVVAEILRLIDR